MRLELCGNLITFFAALFSIVQRHNITAGIAGLSVSYALQVSKNVNLITSENHRFNVAIQY